MSRTEVEMTRTGRCGAESAAGQDGCIERDGKHDAFDVLGSH
jgi:hypothetical protein